MDFFQAQDAARRNTARLVIFFTLAVLSLIVITNLLVMVLFGFLESGNEAITLSVIADRFNWPVFLTIGAFVVLVIFGGSAYKTMALSGGGTVVAESLGGRLISQNTTDFHERKALNVVEEMALASGTPVPLVYLLENEQGINAFAAGYTPGDAVIGLTRGTITYLTREELQGVIAHEFSHILHGDMRLNIRLIGILHGILLIGLIGYFVLRSMRRGSNKNAAPIMGLGLGLLVIGYAGTFFGNLIKASVSRQREFLADASAVQFTRDNSGIAGALKKIGGHVQGSGLETPQAPSMSHAYFSTGVNSFMQSIFATHPPLDIRIQRIDPQWDGIFPPVTQEPGEEYASTEQTRPPSKEEVVKTTAAGVIIASQILDRIGSTSPEQLDHAVTLVNDIPQNIRDAARDPYGARAVIYCLVINQQPDIQNKQLQQLIEFGDSGIFELVQKLLPTLTSLETRLRLPLIDMATPSLRQLSEAQYLLFKKNLLFLMHSDSRIDLFEWSLQKILLRHLDRVFGQISTGVTRLESLKTVKNHINVLLSMLVHTCVKDEAEINAIFEGAEQELGLGTLVLLPPEQITIENLDIAVDKLALLKPLMKPQLLKACLAIINGDKKYSVEEMELMRAIASVLDCPLPPHPLT